MPKPKPSKIHEFDPKRLLNGIVARKVPISKHAETMRIPRIDGWEPGRVWTTWEIDPDIVSPQGTVFGGYLATVSDEMVGMATMSVLEDGESFVTADLRVNFFRPALIGKLTAEATVIHRGRSIAYVEAVFTNAEGKLVAKAAATQMIRQEKNA